MQGWTGATTRDAPTDLEHGAVLRVEHGVGSVREALFQLLIGVAEGGVGEEAG